MYINTAFIHFFGHLRVEIFITLFVMANVLAKNAYLHINHSFGVMFVQL